MLMPSETRMFASLDLFVGVLGFPLIMKNN